jgi:hypothetical protein
LKSRPTKNDWIARIHADVSPDQTPERARGSHELIPSDEAIQVAENRLLGQCIKSRPFSSFPTAKTADGRNLPRIPFSRNFDSDFLVAVDFRVDRAAKEERHTPALVFVKM